MGIKQLSIWFKDRRLYTKILLIISLACVIFLIGNYGVIRMVYYAYDEQLYIKTAQVFSSYVENVNTVFDQIENVSLSLLGDEAFQKNMTILHETEEGAEERKIAEKELRSQLISYLRNMDVFDDFYVLTEKGDIIASTSEIYHIDKEVSDRMYSWALEGGGAPQIVTYQNKLYFLRQIREEKGFKFTDFGAMIGEIDINKILRESSMIYDSLGVGLDLAVYIDGVCMYQKDEELRLLDNDGWEIQRDKFVVQCTTKRGWKFLMYTPYDEIHRSVRQTTVYSIVLFVVVAISGIMISYLLLKSITKHLDKLMVKIDDYGKGVLPGTEAIEEYRQRRDEIGRLHRHFHRMAYEYKRVNEENYNRMLLHKEAQYKQLQQQIQPHFMFNTLSLITWIAYEHQDAEIADLSNALSRMFRESMSFSEKTIRLGDELKLIDDYMLIQGKRYEDRLRYEVEVPRELEEVMIPQMTIQPIVENSIKYALEGSLDSCTIRILGYKDDDTAVVIVEDNGPGIDKDILSKISEGTVETEGNGIGLMNIQKRIQLVFSEDYGLEFHRVNECTQVWIRIPFMNQTQGEENV